MLNSMSCQEVRFFDCLDCLEAHCEVLKTQLSTVSENRVPSTVFERLARYLVDGALERPSELRSD